MSATPTCFNLPIAIGMATSVTAGDTSVTFTTLDGQIVSFTDNFTNATFTGTDRNTAQALKLALKSRERSLSTRPVIRPNRLRTEECRSH
jgi:hypothetical protein